MSFARYFLMMLLAVGVLGAYPKKDKAAPKSPDKDSMLVASNFSGMKLRSIGPAITSGRISDIAVHPQNNSIFYVAVSSGGLWKTTNAGISFSPIFDSENSYSTSCIVIDEKNPNILWLGTGENNSQRSVAWGDGVYRSSDGGASWKRVGLEKSEHIGKIVIDPRNSNVVWVAAQGPLWADGGDRGLYKTTNGGESWELVLSISPMTGVTDVALDPRDPDVAYAASYQRRRHVWALINGGPESAIHKTTDGGKTWTKIDRGLPTSDMGKIGLAVAPANPDILYATIEAASGMGGTYRSTNRGASWEKRNSWVSGSAQYYQEIICDPHDADRFYAVDTYLQYTEDGGKTMHSVSNRHRHVDDHAVWIDPKNSLHILIGGDGGLYESFDRGEKFRFFENLPVTQFYRVAADNAEPFYNVYGGTQDNATWGGPSQTINSGGITNEDWFTVVGGDGYEPQIDPEDPNIVYGQWQYGNVVRYDRRSGESFYIQPQPKKGESLRWNWDTPLLISPHSHTRLYIAANKLFRSDDRGQSWKEISPDLTRQIDRNKLPMMGKVWGADAVAKNASTSFYGNIISITESPIKEGLIYCGTDDGLIQYTEDGGTNWKRAERFAEVPETTYCSDVFCSQHNPKVVYAAFNNHKNGDFRPYLVKSEDGGATWRSIASNLPDNGPVWTIAEDFADPDLLFVGTEFGLFFSNNGGEKWLQLGNGLPTIAVRDLDIQKRESDLVVGTFGRGIYILDNYSPLRFAKADKLGELPAKLFPVKNAVLFNQDDSRSKTDKGENFFRADNPDFGAVFTYFVRDRIQSLKDKRREMESETAPKIDFAELDKERREKQPFLLFTIADEYGRTVRKLTRDYAQGMGRIVWNLRYASDEPITAETNPNYHSGYLVMPGKYKVTLSKCTGTEIVQLGEPQEFTVTKLNNSTLPPPDTKQLDEFRLKVSRIQGAIDGTRKAFHRAEAKLKAAEKAVLASTIPNNGLIAKIRQSLEELKDLQYKLDGNATLSKYNENQPPSINDRIDYIVWGIWQTSSPISETQRMSYKIASDELAEVLKELKRIVQTDLEGYEKEIRGSGAPQFDDGIPGWIPE